MHDVFISYSREEAYSMKHIVARMRARGLDVWVDETNIEASSDNHPLENEKGPNSNHTQH